MPYWCGILYFLPEEMQYNLISSGVVSPRHFRTVKKYFALFAFLIILPMFMSHFMEFRMVTSSSFRESTLGTLIYVCMCDNAQHKQADEYDVCARRAG